MKERHPRVYQTIHHITFFLPLYGMLIFFSFFAVELIFLSLLRSWLPLIIFLIVGLVIAPFLIAFLFLVRYLLLRLFGKPHTYALLKRFGRPIAIHLSQSNVKTPEAYIPRPDLTEALVSAIVSDDLKPISLVGPPGAGLTTEMRLAAKHAVAHYSHVMFIDFSDGVRAAYSKALLELDGVLGTKSHRTNQGSMAELFTATLSACVAQKAASIRNTHLHAVPIHHHRALVVLDWVEDVADIKMLLECSDLFKCVILSHTHLAVDSIPVLTTLYPIDPTDGPNSNDYDSRLTWCSTIPYIYRLAKAHVNIDAQSPVELLQELYDEAGDNEKRVYGILTAMQEVSVSILGDALGMSGGEVLNILVKLDWIGLLDGSPGMSIRLGDHVRAQRHYAIKPRADPPGLPPAYLVLNFHHQHCGVDFDSVPVTVDQSLFDVAPLYHETQRVQLFTSASYLIAAERRIGIAALIRQISDVVTDEDQDDRLDALRLVRHALIAVQTANPHGLTPKRFVTGLMLHLPHHEDLLDCHRTLRAAISDESSLVALSHASDLLHDRSPTIVHAVTIPIQNHATLDSHVLLATDSGDLLLLSLTESGSGEYLSAPKFIGSIPGRIVGIRTSLQAKTSECLISTAITDNLYVTYLVSITSGGITIHNAIKSSPIDDVAVTIVNTHCILSILCSKGAWVFWLKEASCGCWHITGDTFIPHPARRHRPNHAECVACAIDTAHAHGEGMVTISYGRKIRVVRCRRASSGKLVAHTCCDLDTESTAVHTIYIVRLHTDKPIFNVVAVSEDGSGPIIVTFQGIELLKGRPWLLRTLLHHRMIVFSSKWQQDRILDPMTESSVLHTSTNLIAPRIFSSEPTVSQQLTNGDQCIVTLHDDGFTAHVADADHWRDVKRLQNVAYEAYDRPLSRVIGIISDLSAVVFIGPDLPETELTAAGVAMYRSRRCVTAVTEYGVIWTADLPVHLSSSISTWAGLLAGHFTVLAWDSHSVFSCSTTLPAPTQPVTWSVLAERSALVIRDGVPHLIQLMPSPDGIKLHLATVGCVAAICAPRYDRVVQLLENTVTGIEIMVCGEHSALKTSETVRIITHDQDDLIDIPLIGEIIKFSSDWVVYRTPRGHIKGVNVNDQSETKIDCDTVIALGSGPDLSLIATHSDGVFHIHPKEADVKLFDAAPSAFDQLKNLLYIYIRDTIWAVDMDTDEVKSLIEVGEYRELSIIAHPVGRYLAVGTPDGVFMLDLAGSGDVADGGEIPTVDSPFSPFCGTPKRVVG